MNNELTVISYNIWFENTLDTERTVSLVKIINDTNPDIICLQEVRPNIYDCLLHVLTNHRYHFPKKFTKPYDCVIFSKFPIEKCLEYNYNNSVMGRSLQVAKIDYPYHNNDENGVAVENVEIVVANTHFESLFKKKYINEPKVRQFEISSGILDIMYQTYGNVIFCADTNVLTHEEYKFEECFEDWIDAWKIKGSESNKYTYDSYNNIFLQNRFPVKYLSRIDRILLKSNNLIPDEFRLLKASGNIIEPSDHFGILCKMKVHKNLSDI